MPKALKRVLVVVGAILVAVAVVLGGYIAYLMLTYDRIPDGVEVEVGNNPEAVLQAGEQYAAATYNIGFGAYSPDYTFFLDTGIAADGTETAGEHSTAASREAVEANTVGAIEALRGLDADFALLQEVDTDSTRSYHVNQRTAFEAAFPDDSSAFAQNFHSAYLAYPFDDPHGTVNAGLLEMGDAHVASAVRRSYPVPDAFPSKFLDLDRCFLVERLPVDNGKELVLINNHMSAYDEGGTIRAQQLELLNGVLEEEAAVGNYVIVGGDWNHALCGSETMYPSGFQVPEWVSTFDDSDLPSGYSVVRADNIEDVPTCRNNDVPYEAGYTYTVTVDGFVVSGNVKATAENIDTGFGFSDHNPVKLTFELE